MQGINANRLFDFAAAAAGLAAFWPVIAALMIAIRLGSVGPAIFAQTRVGRNGQSFTCYKLRTMCSGTANLPTHEVGASALTAIGGSCAARNSTNCRSSTTSSGAI
jgi:O-antigen biosynthesis protein WbqP